MNIQYQLDTFVNLITQKIKESLSSKKKNIAIISYYPTYRSNYGNLIAELKKDYNVITIVERILNDDFEKSAHANFHFPWRIIEGATHYYLNTDIKEIDLIITADQVGYQEGKIDRTFLSKKAKRISLPHRLTTDCGVSDNIDYIIVPSKTAMQEFKLKTSKMKVKLLPCGYPQFDVTLENYHYTPANTITYAPTLRYVDTRYSNLNAYAGFDCNMIEWLLENTQYNVSYRSHPINYTNNHLFHQQIKARFQHNPRVAFDCEMGNKFFNFSDYLITDWSTTSFAYSYATLRPSFFFMPFPLDKELKRGGYIIEEQNSRNFAELKHKLDSIDFESQKTFFKKLRDTNVYNVGTSCQAIKEQIDSILKGKK